MQRHKLYKIFNAKKFKNLAGKAKHGQSTDCRRSDEQIMAG